MRLPYPTTGASWAARSVSMYSPLIISLAGGMASWTLPWQLRASKVHVLGERQSQVERESQVETAHGLALEVM